MKYSLRLIAVREDLNCDHVCADIELAIFESRKLAEDAEQIQNRAIMEAWGHAISMQCLTFLRGLFGTINHIMVIRLVV